jgi:hypothetical protein
VTDPSDLRKAILLLGQEVISCPLRCEGIVNDPSSGTLPRSLIFDDDARHGQAGSIVLGVNPGRARDDEKAYFLRHGNTYEAFLAFWQERQSHAHPYHVRTKRFLDEVGLTGPILWTELVKCENPPDVKAVPPLGTLRACVNRHLTRELSLVPRDWPIVALGRKPFELAAIMFPGRTVMGIPHPTGSFGHFHRMFDPDRHLLRQVKGQASSAVKDGSPIATWIEAPRAA